jgi:hypothetical protein
MADSSGIIIIKVCIQTCSHPDRLKLETEESQRSFTHSLSGIKSWNYFTTIPSMDKRQVSKELRFESVICQFKALNFCGGLYLRLIGRISDTCRH